LFLGVSQEGQKNMVLTVPTKLLNESQGHVVSLELTNGILYRGKLLEAEDNMNVQLKDVVITGKDGSTKTASQVYIRGSQIQFISVPDILAHAPMFENKK
jgi:small nuclear ribonucleoprotein D3